MSEVLEYKLMLEVSDGTDVESFEEFFEDVLMDLYEESGLEYIKVVKVDSDDSIDIDVDGKDKDAVSLIDLIERAESRNIIDAIETVKLLEELSTDDDE